MTKRSTKNKDKAAEAEAKAQPNATQDQAETEAEAKAKEEAEAKAEEHEAQEAERKRKERAADKAKRLAEDARKAQAAALAGVQGPQGPQDDSPAVKGMLATLEQAQDKMRKVLVEIERFEAMGDKLGRESTAGRVQIGTAARLRAQHGLPPRQTA